MQQAHYKHVPHCHKPVHIVAKRNARERRRVQAVNSAFVQLRKCVPVENRKKRLSKVKTLHKAIEYIGALKQLLASDQSGAMHQPLDQSSEQSLQYAQCNTGGALHVRHDASGHGSLDGYSSSSYPPPPSSLVINQASSYLC